MQPTYFDICRPIILVTVRNHDARTRDLNVITKFIIYILVCDPSYQATGHNLLMTMVVVVHHKQGNQYNFNSLHLNISMYILHTVLYTFP